MKEELVFVERQRFRRWFIVTLLLLAIGMLFHASISQYFAEKTWDNNPIGDMRYIIVLFLLLSIFAEFFFIRLDTVINKEGVYFRMFPFHTRFQFTSWEHISEAVVMKINPFGGFGGWGMRFKVLNFGGSGIHIGFGSKSYTISGNKMLKLELKNNKRIYLGTRKPEELSDFLIKLDAERKQK